MLGLAFTTLTDATDPQFPKAMQLVEMRIDWQRMKIAESISISVAIAAESGQTIASIRMEALRRAQAILEGFAQDPADPQRLSDLRL